MKTGTKSVLIGAHQFIIHPIEVYLAWKKLYKVRPTFKEIICIIVHDWGYFGKSSIDGDDGRLHPHLGGKMAGKLFDEEYAILCYCHSRYYAKILNLKPSKLCWADKYCLVNEPWWLYIPRVILSGEIHEFREEYKLDGSNKFWYNHIRALMTEQAQQQKEEG